MRFCNFSVLMNQISNMLSFLRRRRSRRWNSCLWFKDFYATIWHFHCSVLIYTTFWFTVKIFQFNVLFICQGNVPDLIIIFFLWKRQSTSRTSPCIRLKLLKLSTLLQLFNFSRRIPSLLNLLHRVLQLLNRVGSVLINRILSPWCVSFWITSTWVQMRHIYHKLSITQLRT